MIKNEKLKIAVLVECHPFDIIKFQEMLWSFADCECYVQAFDLFVQDELNQGSYDVVLYYNMNLPLPEDASSMLRYLEEELGNSKQGIVLLHHALLSFPKWDLFTEVSGVKVRCEDTFSYHQNQTVTTYLENPAHPILQGVQNFTITDETYQIGEPEEEGNEILLTTDNTVSIKNIAWTRQYKNSRVFCYASGHDNLVYQDENFRKILHNGILWAANKR